MLKAKAQQYLSGLRGSDTHKDRIRFYRQLKSNQDTLKHSYSENNLSFFKTNLGDHRSINLPRVSKNTCSKEKQKIMINMQENINDFKRADKLLQKCAKTTGNIKDRNLLDNLNKHIFIDEIQKTAKDRLRQAVLNESQLKLLKLRIGNTLFYFICKLNEL